MGAIASQIISLTTLLFKCFGCGQNCLIWWAINLPSFQHKTTVLWFQGSGRCLYLAYSLLPYSMNFFFFCRESDMTREKWRAIEAFETKSRRTVGEDASKWVPRTADVMAWIRFPHYWPFVRGILGNRWTPSQKACNAKLWCLPCCSLEQAGE